MTVCDLHYKMDSTVTMNSWSVYIRILAVLICWTGINIASDGEWTRCSANITSYTGCTITINALYDTTDVSQSCSNDFKYFTSLNKNQLISPITINAVNRSDTVCNISSTLTLRAGLHDVTFLAQRISDAVSIECHDSVLVEDIVLQFTNIDVNCNGVLLEWTGLPSLLNEYHYTLQIDNTDYITPNTSILIQYNSGLMHHQQYNISIIATYCGGTNSDKTNDAFYTAIAPQIDYTNTIDVYNHNTTHVTVIYNTKVTNIGCVVSYPDTVSINGTCNRYNTAITTVTLLYTRSVIVDDEGILSIDLVVPIDAMCSIELTFNNEQLATSTNSISTSSTQLQSCSPWVNEEDVGVLCRFSPISRLTGCHVTVTEETNRWNYSVNITSNAQYGHIASLCNGVYTVLCYGIDNDHLIDYTEYSRTITITSGYDCAAKPTVTNNSTITPSIIHIETNDSISFLITVYSIVFIIVLCASITITVSVTLFVDKKRQSFKHFIDQRHLSTATRATVLSSSSEAISQVELKDRTVLYSTHCQDKYDQIEDGVQFSISSEDDSKQANSDTCYRPLLDESSSSEIAS